MLGDPPSHGDDPFLLAQVRESFGRVVYSFKINEKQADICTWQHRALQGGLILLTALSSGTFLISVIGLWAEPLIASLVTSFVALLVTAVSLGTKTFRPADEADAHRATAVKLWHIRESYIALIADLMAGVVAIADARARRDELQEQTRLAYSAAPRTGRRAFKKASKGLKENEEMTFDPSEIDKFLPAALCLTAKGDGA